MIEKLIKLLQDNSYIDVLDEECWVCAAEQLLANGVIVLPFPIGTKYYRIVMRSGKYAGDYCVIREALLSYYNIDKVLNDFGKTVFLTREEAEQALK